MNLSVIATLLSVGPPDVVDLNHYEGPSPFAHAWGVMAFVAVYVLLLVWLLLMPARLLNEPADRPWWKSSRLWAVSIAIVQIIVYLSLG